MYSKISFRGNYHELQNELQIVRGPSEARKKGPQVKGLHEGELVLPPTKLAIKLDQGLVAKIQHPRLMSCETVPRLGGA